MLPIGRLDLNPCFVLACNTNCGNAGTDSGKGFGKWYFWCPSRPAASSAAGGQCAGFGPRPHHPEDGVARNHANDVRAPVRPISCSTADDWHLVNIGTEQALEQTEQ